MNWIKFWKFLSKDLLKIIFRILGKPTDENWPDAKNLPHYKDSFPNFDPIKFQEILPNLETSGIDLISMMLHYDPNKRITAKQALLHVYIYYFLLIF